MRIFRPKTLTLAQATKWETTREKGRARHVLLIGALYWGGSLAIWMSAFQYWTNPETFEVVRNIGINALVCPISGIFFGWWTWVVSERNYLAFHANNKKTEQGAHGDAEPAP